MSLSPPTSGKTYLGQTQESYCVECCVGHTMTALTEMRHAVDRCRTSGGVTEGVQEKVRNAIGELMGITYDVQDLSVASPHVKEGLEQIVDEVRWIRKEADSVTGLTSGKGTCADLIALRNRIRALQDKGYDLLKTCPTCLVPTGKNPVGNPETSVNGASNAEPKKSLNKEIAHPTTRVGERKMARVEAKDLATDALVGFVAGTSGAAIHFLGFAPFLDQYNVAGVKGGAIADIAVGIIAIIAGNYVGYDWLKPILLIMGGTMIGLGFSHAVGWIPGIATVAARAPAPYPYRPITPPVAAPAIF